MNEATSHDEGVNVAVEAPYDLQVSIINYDGTEVFEEPPKFADVLAEHASKVPWKSIIDSAAAIASAKVVKLEIDEDENEEEKALQQDEAELRAFAAVREAARERITPTAGPWMMVAKSLHESMQEVDVLLDLLRITQKRLTVPHTDEVYMNILQVAPQIDDTRSTDLQNRTKSFFVASRRKALDEAAQVSRKTANIRYKPSNTDKTSYFDQLKEMRENWRIRKVNDLMFGDLGYHSYGKKFEQSKIFDIYWNSKSHFDARGSIEVQVPRNLMRRIYIAVSLIKDNGDYQYGDDGSQQKRGEKLTQRQTSSRHLDWRIALKWAQESLINNDIFLQIMKESLDVEYICVPTEHTLAVCLNDSMILHFTRHLLPLEPMKALEACDTYLTETLRRLFVEDIAQPPQRPQMFVGFPSTKLPESLDFRGPHGITTEEIMSRVIKPTSLLKRMLAVSNHYLLLDQVLDVLMYYAISKDDNNAQLTWRWTRCTPTFTMISASFINPGFESLSKTTFQIHLHENEVHILSRENAIINCYRQMRVLHEALSLMAASSQLVLAVMLARIYGWQVLHANSSAFSKEGTPAPSFYASNQAAKKRLFIQFFTDGRPAGVNIKRTEPPTAAAADDAHIKRESHADADGGGGGDVEMGIDARKDGAFTRVNSDRVPGRALMRKVEHLLTMFRA